MTRRPPISTPFPPAPLSRFVLGHPAARDRRGGAGVRADRAADRLGRIDGVNRGENRRPHGCAPGTDDRLIGASAGTIRKGNGRGAPDAPPVPRRRTPGGPTL